MNFKRSKKNLPDAYQEVEYIQSGLIYLQTGYIDTGLVGTDLYGCEIETCMKVTAITTSNLYYLNGAYVAGQTTQTGLIREDTEYVHSVVNMGFNTASYSGSIALSDWHTIYTSDGIQKTDGIIVTNETYGTFNNLRYLLFARSDTGVTLSPPFAMKYFWIKKNGQYIRNMIPAKRKSDNVVGMYDIANDVFYTSENQYTFIGGAVVEPTWHDTPHYIHNTSTDTLTTLPAVLYPNAVTATVGLKGQMEQSGTPTPTNPIQPSETGERTGNLFDISSVIYGTWTNNTGEVQPYVYGARSISISSNQITVSFNGSVFPFSYSIVWLDSNDGFIVRDHKSTSISTPQTFTPPSNAAKFYIQVSNGTDPSYPITKEQIESYKLMLNLGSTALPYEPYGNKIPILNNMQTTNVYLGEVESTRRIKKLVLTGEETWASYTSIADCYRLSIASEQGVTGQGICSHYAIVGTTSQLTDGTFVSGQNYSYFNDISAQNLDGWKTYLAQQYAAGTPVTVWYVLATETTGIVNEPIRKIGTYADTVSGITIPTIAGANTISIGTTLQPSEVTATYKGWHPVSSVHERDNGAWT